MFYHRDRDEYVERTCAAASRGSPKRSASISTTNREAHFFAGDDAKRRREHAVPRSRAPALSGIEADGRSRSATIANFWVIEGVATYFETLTEHDDPQAGLYFTIGESTAGRLPAARERLQDGFYIPLAELTQLGKDDVQRHAEIAKLYSQSSGLAAFLMDGEQGRYREPLVRYLQAVYAGRDNDRVARRRRRAAAIRELDAAVSPISWRACRRNGRRYRVIVVNA